MLGTVHDDHLLAVSGFLVSAGKHDVAISHKQAKANLEIDLGRLTLVISLEDLDHLVLRVILEQALPIVKVPQVLLKRNVVEGGLNARPVQAEAFDSLAPDAAGHLIVSRLEGQTLVPAASNVISILSRKFIEQRVITDGHIDARLRLFLDNALSYGLLVGKHLVLELLEVRQNKQLGNHLVIKLLVVLVVLLEVDVEGLDLRHLKFIIEFRVNNLLKSVHVGFVDACVLKLVLLVLVEVLHVHGEELPLSLRKFLTGDDCLHAVEDISVHACD